MDIVKILGDFEKKANITFDRDSQGFINLVGNLNKTYELIARTTQVTVSEVKTVLKALPNKRFALVMTGASVLFSDDALFKNGLINANKFKVTCENEKVVISIEFDYSNAIKK